jgi:hypothetical protein
MPQQWLHDHHHHYQHSVMMTPAPAARGATKTWSRVDYNSFLSYFLFSINIVFFYFINI